MCVCTRTCVRSGCDGTTKDGNTSRSEGGDAIKESSLNIRGCPSTSDILFDRTCLGLKCESTH